MHIIIDNKTVCNVFTFVIYRSVYSLHIIVSSVRRGFFSTRVINMWNNLPADTTDFSSLRKFCASAIKDYLLTFGTVYFM